MEKKITTVVFDMGQVLIHWTPFKIVEHMGLTEADKALLMTELFQSVEWVQTDHGTIELSRVVEQVNARLPSISTALWRKSSWAGGAARFCPWRAWESW